MFVENYELNTFKEIFCILERLDVYSFMDIVLFKSALKSGSSQSFIIVNWFTGIFRFSKTLIYLKYCKTQNSGF